MAGQRLAYVAVIARDVEALAESFARQLDLARADLEAEGGRVPVFALGAAAIALFAPGHPYVGGRQAPGLDHVALAADDPEAAAAELGATGRPAAALGGGRRVALDAAATAGVATWLAPPLDLGPSRSSQVERIDHLGVASADNARALAAWTGPLGCALESQQTDVEMALAVESFTSDKYGVVYHTRPPEPVGGLRVAFVTVGDAELEFLQSFDPRLGAHVERGAAGTTRQDHGAIARFVAARGEGLHHVALKTADIDGLLGRLDRAGLPLIDRRGRPGSRRARIGFVHPKGLGGILIHFVQRD